jgi:predicted transcriptional regulator YheO
VGSQIKAERVFSIAAICINFQRSQLGIKNLEMLICIYKNSPNDARVEDMASMKHFMNMEEALMEENEDVVEQIGLFKLEESNNRF